MNEGRTIKIFLWSIAGFVVLILAVLGWSLTLGSSSSNTIGQPETDLAFNDENAPSKGPNDAKVVVRIFGDFQCPACGTAEPALEEAMKIYEKRVRFLWDDFPLISLHEHAYDAAKAARCAQEQGKFWEFHDKLYSTQGTWVTANDLVTAMQNIAEAVEMNVPAFSICYSDDRYGKKIQEDLKEGASNRVDATPTFFVNTTRYPGALPLEKWKSILDEALKTSGS